MSHFERFLKAPEDSFFLFGPRGVGKSTWLKDVKAWGLQINLLNQTEYFTYLKNPSHLRARAEALEKGSWIWIDEVQKVPALLDEVHSLIEDKKLKFALSGSSARKLKRGGANLLAGRAITRTLLPLSRIELKDQFNLDQALDYGTLPLVINKPQIRSDILKTYVSTYLREEIQEEGHVRKIEPFVRFLEIAAIFNGQIVNSNNIARDSGVSRPSIDGYFSILVDTLIGNFLPAFQPKIKVKEVNHPKFYWFDPGVARAAAGLLDETVESEWRGRALETYLFHELRTYNSKTNRDFGIYYYRTQSGLEVDFVVVLRKGTLSRKPHVVLIECKNSKKWDPRWEKSLLEIYKSKKVDVKAMICIYRGNEILKRNDVLILPVEEFLKMLFDGKFY